MSFTTDTAAELLALPIGKTCCRKAFLLGLFFGGKSELDKGTVTAFFRMEELADMAKDLLKKQFSSQAGIEQIVYAGRRVYKVSANSKVITNFLTEAKRPSQKCLSELVGFRCQSCSHEFLRGVFLAAATVSDPRKGYHLEFSLKDANEADKLFYLLSEEIAETAAPKRVTRGNSVGLYYKSNGCISDMLYFVGAVQTSFDFANVCIERDIRNIENRATNCVTKNISRAVGASQKHIAAIEKLTECHKMESLSEELRYTARLRIENDSASLSELALLHVPPITKSGLNQRLNKLLRLAEDLE